MKARTPLDPEAVVLAALRLLNREGFEGLTLRRLAGDLGVKAPALYWHFKDKQELLDEMATEVFRQGFHKTGMPAKELRWQDWCRQLAIGERQMLLLYRDGARIFSGTYLTDPAMYAPMEASLEKLTGEGLSLTEALTVMSTLHCYVVGFAIEEQAVWPDEGKRDARYAPEQRAERFAKGDFPLSLGAGEALFMAPDDRFLQGLEGIVCGFEALHARRSLADAQS